MKCLSLWQPWASLVILGDKTVETRSWQPPEKLLPRGSRLLIHAAKKWDAELQDITTEGPFAECFDRVGILLSDPPLGAILGAVTFLRAVPTEQLVLKLSDREIEFGNYDDGRYGWVLSTPVRFLRPIPYRGAQGIFDVPDQVVDAAIAEAAQR